MLFLVHQNMLHKILLFILTISIVLCTNLNNIDNKKVEYVTLGNIVYAVKDTTSQLLIYHEESTDCLDAIADSGTVYLPDSVMNKIKLLYSEKDINIEPYNLHFVEKDKISEILFGDSTNYWHYWHNRYAISGKAIDIFDNGILFKVDGYKKIESNKE
jgi:hypothetical protein